ncbi:hypothetical protein C0Q70_13790 [Pomacea canaliculata]|uniref:Uncharacterized protein n=1 Tax=Pomacea canaliculata TaxID=400727 RepID=A0A2T7NY77_POMCA|nr:hypothetical protein C0Q70_13790 [Pomacea canaliculata]
MVLTLSSDCELLHHGASRDASSARLGTRRRRLVAFLVPRHARGSESDYSTTPGVFGELVYTGMRQTHFNKCVRVYDGACVGLGEWRREPRVGGPTEKTDTPPAQTSCTSTPVTVGAGSSSSRTLIKAAG